MTNEQHDANQIEDSHENAQGAQELLSSNVKIVVRSRHQQSDQSGSCQNTFSSSSSRNTDQTTIWRCGWMDTR